MSADFYDLLEVPEDASQDEIRDAFRSKVREYHPDHNDDPRANAQFTALKKAYDTLGDPVERNAYDRMGHLDYVGKRLDGLPDPDTWAPQSSSGSGTTTSSSVSNASSGTGSGRRSGSSRTSSSTSGSSRTSSSTGRSSGTSSSSTGRSGSSGRRSSGGSSQRTASDGAGTATGRATDYDLDPVVEWIARHDNVRRIVGWELLWVVLGVYALALAAFARANLAAVLDLLGRVVAAGSDPGAVWSALDRQTVPVVADAVLWPLLDGSAGALTAIGGLLLLAGVVLLPAAVGLLVYVTRTTPGWKPTFAYVAATVGPLIGVLAGLAAAPPLWLELVLFGVLPIGAVLVMVLSAFVRPRVLIFLHNLRS